MRARVLWLAVLATLIAAACVFLLPISYAYVPSRTAGLNPWRTHTPPTYDIWGEEVDAASAKALLATTEGRARLSPARGAVRIDDDVIERGYDAFHAETFGNELVLSDIVGILDGPLTPVSFLRALVALGGRGTTNLRVPIAYAVTVGGRRFEQGQLIDTGLDVPRGAYAILGMKMRAERGRVRAGITCAACHSTVDSQTLRVIHGAPNWDLNTGALLALATNSAAFFMHTDVDPRAVRQDPGRTVTGADGRPRSLPDVRALEDAVDARLLQWPPGSFDSIVDLQAAPTKLPHAWAFESWPYNYSGSFATGPFKGLSVQTNNVHALNSDPTTMASAAPALFGIDTEQYLGILLQGASQRSMRYQPSSGVAPSAFLDSVDPTPGQPGIVEAIALPTFPRATPVSPTSLWNSRPGEPVWASVNAMAAWQLTLAPPAAPVTIDPTRAAAGRAVFERAGCAACHAGRMLTNHHVLPAPVVGTQAIRAKGMANTARAAADPVGYAFDERVPLSDRPRVLAIPPGPLSPYELRLAMGWDPTPGGFRVPSLQGLYWTTPYLHDGGVAVGRNAAVDVGVAGTLGRHIRPDPANSLRALVDRNLRSRVVDANRRDAALRAVHVEGVGHAFWADAEAGYTRDEQSALIDYLIGFTPPR